MSILNSNIRTNYQPFTRHLKKEEISNRHIQTYFSEFTAKKQSMLFDTLCFTLIAPMFVFNIASLLSTHLLPEDIPVLMSLITGQDLPPVQVAPLFLIWFISIVVLVRKIRQRRGATTLSINEQIDAFIYFNSQQLLSNKCLEILKTKKVPSSI